jgi:hypothetical protein
MSRTADPFVRRLAAAGDCSPHARGSATPPRTFAPLDDRLDAGSRPPLVEVAAALVQVVRGVLPSCTCAVVTEIGGAWQTIARGGPADETAYLTGHLADLDLTRCDVAMAGRHLVARLPSRRVPAFLLLLSSRDDADLPTGTAGRIYGLLDEAGPKLDAAAGLQRRERALRRLEVLHTHGTGADPVRDVRELEEVVAGLWPAATARYVPRGTAEGLDPVAARIVREACACSTTIVASPLSDATPPLHPVDHAHRLAVVIPGSGALLVEVAAAGEELDLESVAAAGVVARLYALADRERRLQLDREILRGIGAAARRIHDQADPPSVA